MKKSFVFLILLALPLVQMTAQNAEPTFVKGNMALNLGIGFGSSLYSGTYITGKFPPISASFEVCVADNILEKGTIGVGGYLGYTAYKWDYLGWGYKYTNIIIGPRGSFHYPLVNKLDTYTGILLGYNIATSKEFGTSTGYDYNATNGGVVWSWFLGARYYLTNKFAVMAELGYGIAYLNLGVAFKF